MQNPAEGSFSIEEERKEPLGPKELPELEENILEEEEVDDRSLSNASSVIGTEGPKIFALTPMRSMLFILTSTILQWTYGFGSNMIQSNVTEFSEAFQATPTQVAWLLSAYMAPNVSLAIILIKIRTQYGLRIFANISIIFFVIANLLNLFITDLSSALLLRFFSGICASPISSLAFLYMMQAFVPEKKYTIGLSLNLMNMLLSVPLAHIISPVIFKNQDLDSLVLFEMGLAILCSSLIFAFPLALAPLQKVIEKLDLFSYSLIAVGLGLNAVIMPVGFYYGWYAAPWIGICFIIALICLVCAAIIEVNRTNPLVDLRWLLDKEILHIAFILFIFRLLMSEQSSLVASFFPLFSFTSQDVLGIYFSIGCGVILGGLCCACFYRPSREDIFYIIAMLFLTLGAYMDSHMSLQPRPQDMYLSQGFIGFGSALFFPPAMARGLAKALACGQKYVLTFIAVFLLTQSTGGLMSSAFFNSLEHIYQSAYFTQLFPINAVENVLLGAPSEIITKPYDFIAPIEKKDEELIWWLKDAFLQAHIWAYIKIFKLYFYIGLTVFMFLFLKYAYQKIFYRYWHFYKRLFRRYRRQRRF